MKILDSVLLFGRSLREAGLAVSLEQSLSFARALDHVDVGDRDHVFHAARALFVNRKDDLPVFDAVFERFWLGRAAPGESASVPAARPELRRSAASLVTETSAHAATSETEIETPERAATYSAEERLRRREFSRLTGEERDAVLRLIRDTDWKIAARRTRRLAPSRRGARLDLRRMLREAARHGGVPPLLRHRSRKVKQRPMVLLADISGSMEKYSRLVLELFFSATQSLEHVECFVFGTRLTRITPQLRLRDVDRALAETAGRIVDWSGGTRIGASLAAFNRRWARRVLGRGAVVVIVSDGWERGDVSLLAREMRHLYHRCYRLVWLNPYSGRPGYEPRVAGMSAALPFVDDFLPVHDLDALDSLSEHLAELPARRTRLPAGGGRATL